MNHWKDRVALVTGVSGGIGEATARALVAQGMKVAGCARSDLSALSQDLGDRFLPVGCDLRDEGQIAAMFDAVEARWGGVDVLVNNAGLGFDAPLLDGPVDRWREMLEVNVLALSICTWRAVRSMRQRGNDGVVVHVSSMSAHRVPPNGGVYSATKHAVKALAEGLRQELHAAGSGIRVAQVSPGFVQTGFAANFHQSEEQGRAVYARYKVLDATDVAEAIVFVLSQPPHVAVHDILLRPTAQSN